jgi:NAD(P)-dependent dehydrogenase (short-subunit alcohol dehydrogenase family)
MSEMRFDGRVVIVTGAGGQAPSMGRSHAHLLAARGAKVVVNDYGFGFDGLGTLKADAEHVADEIRAAGGEAVADTHSVASEQSALAVVNTALDTWGRVDALINNANVTHFADFDGYTAAQIQAQIEVSFLGTLWMCRAAWPHMKKAGYGRVVNILSGQMHGGHHCTVYGASKGGSYGLANNLAVEGSYCGIKVNSLMVGALTNALMMAVEIDEAAMTMWSQMTPEAVSPAVAFLAHEDCPTTGRLFSSAGGAMSEHVVMATPGYMSATLTPEEIRDHFDQVRDRSAMTEVVGGQDAQVNYKGFSTPA